MPILDNPRHERFAQEVAQGRSATEAYAAAGYTPNQPSASRLLSNVMVQARVAELQGKVSRKVEVTLESLLAEAEEARALAITLKQPGAAIAAIKEKGVLAGVRVEKRENTNRHSAREMTDDELAAIASGSGAGANPAASGSKVTH